MFKLNISDIFKRAGKNQAKKRDERSHHRFTIPGAQVRVRIMQKRGFRQSKPITEYFPLSDMSRGGIRFPSSRLFKPETPMGVAIYLPDKDKPIHLHGKVRWFGVYPGISFTYHIGVEFAAFSEKPGTDQNSMKSFSLLVQLEKKYAAMGAPSRAAA